MPDLVVDDRTLVLGLDEFYRTAMRRHESQELLGCARAVCRVLAIEERPIPVEGYYSEEPRLAEYFRLVRALDAEHATRRPEVEAEPAFQRLCEVRSSAIYGRPVPRESLLPLCEDPLSGALLANRPTWTLAGLTARAEKLARTHADYSLVGIAARLRDPVPLAAVRESVILYSGRVRMDRDVPKYEWNVSAAIAEAAGAFTRTFNALFDDHLPAPTVAHAAEYWEAAGRADIVGRCACLGETDDGRFYHWAIAHRDGDPVLHEFWDDDVWTTERYTEHLETDWSPEV